MSDMCAVEAERALILLGAGTAVRREASRERARRLACVADWRRLTGTLRRRRLLTVLGPRILELAAEHAGEGFARELEEALAEGRRSGALLGLITTRAMDALNDAGIRSASLKGPLLGEAIYGELGRRPSSDIDLLVAPEQLHAAVEVIRALGYLAPTDHVDAHGLPLLHFALAHARGELPPIELHWRVHWYERRFASECLLAPAGVHAPGWRPAPEAELASLLLFYARDGFVDLRLACDVGAWWDAEGARLRGGALVGLLDSHPALARVLGVAVAVAERVVGIPSGRLLDMSARLDLRGRLAARLANPNPHSSPPQLYADVGMIDALLMPSGHIRAYVRRQLLPPREVLRERARQAQQRRASSSLGHGARVLSRYGLTIARLVRAPEI
jgi:hypothetical protein